MLTFVDLILIGLLQSGPQSHVLCILLTQFVSHLFQDCETLSISMSLTHYFKNFILYSILYSTLNFNLIFKFYFTRNFLSFKLLLSQYQVPLNFTKRLMFRASEPKQRTATILVRGEKSGSLIVQITHVHHSPKFDPECYHGSQSVLGCARTRMSHDFDTTNLPSQ